MPEEIISKMYIISGTSITLKSRNNAIDWKNSFPDSKVYKIVAIEEIEFEITEKVK